MTTKHLYIVAAIGALLYWRAAKAKTAQAKNTAPTSVDTLTGL